MYKTIYIRIYLKEFMYKNRCKTKIGIRIYVKEYMSLNIGQNSNLNQKNENK